MSAIQDDICKEMINPDFTVYMTKDFWSFERISRSSWTESFFARFQKRSGAPSRWKPPG